MSSENASTESDSRLVPGRVGSHGIAGLAVGLPAALALARLMHAVVFGITTHDPLTFVVLATAVLSSTVLGRALPARRAVRVSPLTAMRAE